MLQGSYGRHARRAIPGYIMLVLLILGGVFFSEYFATARNYYSILNQSASLVLCAMGQTLVIMAGGIDLSVGHVMALSACIVATYNETMGMVPAVLLILLVGVVVGVCNGVGVTKLGIPPMIMTMATQFICRGFALIIRPRAGGSIPKPVYKFFTWKSGPVSTMFFVILIASVLMFYILQCSRFGRRMYAIGGNATAARRNGIDVDTNTITAYVICSIFAVVAGVIVAARMGSADAYCGDTYALDSITATVIGGTGMEGGVGGVTGTLGGAILVAILSNVMNMLRIDTMVQYLVRGAILILALVIHFDKPAKAVSKKGSPKKEEELQEGEGRT